MGEVQRNTIQMKVHTASRNTLAACNPIKIYLLQEKQREY